MTINHVHNIINTELAHNGYRVSSTERSSKTTQSIYYTIYGNGCQMLFRVSDHPTGRNVITLRVDRKLNEQQVRSFVKNRIKDLSHRNVKQLLGL